ncbi:MAG: hypothetical protein RL254_325 [Planctomycetota bacterium]
MTMHHVITATSPPRKLDHALPFTAIRASERFSGQGATSGPVRPAPPNRRLKRESAKRPPRRPTQASWPTPPVNEKARLDFEAGLELPRLDSNQ